MATRFVTLPADGSWQLVTDQAEWLVQNISSNEVKVHIGASAPAAGAAYHSLGTGEGISTVGTGSVYAKSSWENAFVTVTD